MNNTHALAIGVLAVVTVSAALGGCGQKATDPLAAARASFAQALRDSGLVTDPALANACASVPLHELVDPPTGAEAYGEWPLVTTALGVTESPIADVLMVQAAKLRGGNDVLDVSPGIGYRAALCAFLGAHVVCLAGSPDEAQRLRAALQRVGCGSVIVEVGIKTDGCAKYGPYNVLFADWDPTGVPETVLDQVRNQGRVVLMPRAAPNAISVFRCQKTTLQPVETIDLSWALQQYRAARMAVK
ncbi:MAG: hypothetical protein H5T86_05095 [Armatimonadetes bacterium]|nr:hypothetical protein [Armatimonadota bacterium]